MKTYNAVVSRTNLGKADRVVGQIVFDFVMKRTLPFTGALR